MLVFHLKLHLLMFREVLQGKIHQATVTEADVNYVGSITIDVDLMERAGFWPGQKVLVVSNTSGARLETYVIEGERESGRIGMNGAAAHLINAGEEIIIIGFCFSEKPIEPKAILVDKKNRFVKELREKATPLASLPPAPV
tara:strand:- start:22510 stop:22932 length:423 start_codon:yes stop_codon:yes gene_type:complete